MGVGVAGDIEPVTGHLLPVLRRVQQPVHHALIGAWSRVSDEGIDLGRRGGQPAEIEAQATQQGCAVGLRSRGDPFPAPALRQEGVDRVRRCRRGGRCLRRWHRGRSLERPVLLVRCSGLDPSAQQVLLGVTERLVGLGRGHHRIRVGRTDAVPKFAGLQVTRTDRNPALLVGGQRPLGRVEAKPRLPLLGVEAMAGEAVIREDGPDVSIEADVSRTEGHRRRHEPCWDPAR